MSVLERLAALREPLWDDGAWPWEPLPDQAIQALDYRPRRVRFKSALLDRIQRAGRGWSLRHAFRQMNTAVAIAIRHVTPEMEWFKKFPVEQIKPAGNEMRITFGMTGR